LALGWNDSTCVEYTNKDTWLAAIATGSGAHCLKGTATNAIVISGTRVELLNNVHAETEFVHFENNDAGAAHNGGLLFVNQGSKFYGYDTRFTSGTATNGGGVFTNVGSTFNCERCVFTGNTGTANGGAVFNNAGGTVICTTCEFSGNSAQNGGDAFNNVGGTFDLTNSTFQGGSGNCHGVDATMCPSPTPSGATSLSNAAFTSLFLAFALVRPLAIAQVGF